MFDYDVFGQPLQDRPERFRHGFTGKEYDSWTGLYNYGFRDYSAMFGRFTSVDPIQDGHNWYAYVNSDPVNWLDPWGLECPDKESGGDAKKETLYQDDYGQYSTNPNVVTGRCVGEPEPQHVRILVEISNIRNENKAHIGTLSIYYASDKDVEGGYRGKYIHSFPIVSGGPSSPITPPGFYQNLTQAPVKDSSSSTLKDGNHGDDDDVYIRLPGTGGDAIHQANKAVSIDRAYTEGCIAITAEKAEDVVNNYKLFNELLNPYGFYGSDISADVRYYIDPKTLRINR